MKLRTYFWKQRVIPGIVHNSLRTIGINQSRYFKFGNAGDMFCSNIVNRYLTSTYVSVAREGKRFLPIGSLAHIIREGDFLAGIGIKGTEIPKDFCRSITLWGLRGPISYKVFKDHGYDVSNVKYLYDPGLLIKDFVPSSSFAVQKKNVFFIPHYRERYQYKRLPKGIHFLDIDQCPIELSKKILSAKLIYSSSLHGIIFSHSLGVPCVFVRPQTEEPLIKFEDYYLSVGLKFQKPLDHIDSANFLVDSDTPKSISFNSSDIVWPSLDLLEEKKIYV